MIKKWFFLFVIISLIIIPFIFSEEVYVDVSPPETETIIVIQNISYINYINLSNSSTYWGNWYHGDYDLTKSIFWYNFTGTGIYYYNFTGTGIYYYNFTLANIFGYNTSTATYNMYNDDWISTYNESYEGSINNASYLSTYNESYASISGSNWQEYVDNAITTLDLSKNIFLFNNISFSYNASLVNGSGIVGEQIDFNWTFNSTIYTTIGDFSNGTTNFGNFTFESGNVTLSFDENNLVDTVLLMHFDNNFTQDYNLTDDVSIYDNNGFCKSSTTCPVFNSSGYIGGAFEFDGVDDYINAGNDASLDIIDVVTVSAWVKAGAQNSNYNGIVEKALNNINGYGFTTREYTADATQIAFVSSNGTERIRTYWLNNNEWYHLVGVYDGLRLYLYVNGVLVGSLGSTDGIGINSNNLLIGKRSYASLYFNGTIDEVRIWNRSLSSTEIYRNYQKGLKKLQPTLNNYEHNATFTSEIFDLGKNPNMSEISWGQDIPHSSYYFQDGLIFGWDGSNLIDYVNTSRTLTVIGGLLVGNNESIFLDNNATTFDGINDGIDTGTDMIKTKAISVSVWVFTTGAGGNNQGRVIDNGKFRLSYETNNRFLFTSFSPNNVLTPTNLVNNRWYHLAVTRDATGADSKIYIDGIEVGSGDSGTPTVGDTNIFIGNSAGGRAFDGTIDELHIWDRALSSGEINHMYNISKTKYPIVLQTRIGTQSDLSDGNFGNETAIGGFILNSTGEQINFSGGEQYFQYRALFETLDTNVTPKLTDVNFTYFSNTTQFLYGEWLNQSNVTTIYNLEGDLNIKSDTYNEKIMMGLGTIGIIPMFSAVNILTDSIIKQIGTLINIEGDLNVEGDINQSGNFTGNQIYGEMWTDDLQEEVPLRIANQWEAITNLTIGTLNGFIQFNETGRGNATLQALVGGLYKVYYTLSISANRQDNYEFGIAINYVQQDNTETHRKIGSINDLGVISGGGFIRLLAWDNVTLMVKDEDSPLGIVTIDHANINLMRIGN